MHTLRKLIRHKKTPDPDIFHTGESLVPVRRSIDEGHRHLLPSGEALPLPGEAPKVTVTPRSPLIDDAPGSNSDSMRLQLPEPTLAPAPHVGLGTAALGGSSRRSQDLDYVPRGMMASSADHQAGHSLRRSRDFDHPPAGIARASGEYHVGLLATDPDPAYTFDHVAGYEPPSLTAGAAIASHSLRRSQDLDRPPPGALSSAQYHAGLLSRDPIADLRLSTAPSNDFSTTAPTVWATGA